MNKLLQVIFLFSLFFNFAIANEENQLTNEEQEYLSKNKTFTYTGDPNWLPYEAFDIQGNYIGIVAEHLKLIEKSRNLEFKKIVSKNWSDALDIAVSGKADIISGDAADALLNQQFIPIETYLKNPIIVVMKNSENFVLDINDIEDGKIAIIKDYGYTADIYKKYPNITFYELENIQESLDCVSTGECKAMLASYALANYSINNYKYFDLKVVGSTEVTMNVTLFVNKEKPLLHSIINKSMKSISMSDHKNILDKWNKVDEPWIDYKFLNELIVIALLFMAIVLLLL